MYRFEGTPASLFWAQLGSIWLADSSLKPSMGLETYKSKCLSLPGHIAAILTLTCVSATIPRPCGLSACSFYLELFILWNMHAAISSQPLKSPAVPVSKCNSLAGKAHCYHICLFIYLLTCSFIRSFIHSFVTIASFPLPEWLHFTSLIRPQFTTENHKL